MAAGLGAAATDTQPEQAGSLTVFRYDDGQLTKTQSIIPGPGLGPRQRVGAIHVHPSGKFLYLSNRADQNVSGTIDGQPVQYFLGGENNIAGYRLARRSGEPTLIGHWETQGFEARTFTIEPQGRWMIVANQATRNVLEDDGTLTAVPRSLVVFSIDRDGELTPEHKYDFYDGEVFWVGSIELPR